MATTATDASTPAVSAFFTPRNQGQKRKAAPSASSVEKDPLKRRTGSLSWRSTPPFPLTLYFEGKQEMAKCLVCDGKMQAKAKNLNRHVTNNKKHKEQLQRQQGTDGAIGPFIAGRTTGPMHIREDIVTVGYFLCKNKKPFSDAPKQKELLQSLNCTNKRMVNHSTFCMSDSFIKEKVVLKAIRPFFLSELKTLFAECMTFSLMF